MKILFKLFILSSLCVLLPASSHAQVNDTTQTYLDQLLYNVKNIDQVRSENARKMKQIRKEAEKNRDLIEEQNYRNRQAQKDMQDKIDKSREKIRENQARNKAKQRQQKDLMRRQKEQMKAQQQMLKDRMRSMSRK